VLDSHIGLIYGEAINPSLAQKILNGLKEKGFASSNIVFGVGSFGYTVISRDTLGFAMKATAGIVNGKEIQIFKDPKTDKGLKKSAKGFLIVLKDEKGEFCLKDQISFKESQDGELKEVFRDGKLLIDQSLAEIRARVNAS